MPAMPSFLLVIFVIKIGRCLPVSWQPKSTVAIEAKWVCACQLCFDDAFGCYLAAQCCPDSGSWS